MTIFWILWGVSVGSLVGPVVIVLGSEDLELPSGWWVLPGLIASVFMLLAVLT